MATWSHFSDIRRYGSSPSSSPWAIAKWLLLCEYMALQVIFEFVLRPFTVVAGPCEIEITYFVVLE